MNRVLVVAAVACALAACSRPQEEAPPPAEPRGPDPITSYEYPRAPGRPFSCRDFLAFVEQKGREGIGALKIHDDEERRCLQSARAG